jgi:PAS domain S-box-containing protein
MRELGEVWNSLGAREEWLQLAAQQSQMGLWYWNEMTKELFWDAKTRTIFGAPLDGGVTLETFYRALHPEDFERVTLTWRYAFEHGLPYEVEGRTRRPNGTTRWIYARGHGHYDDAGKPMYMVGVVFDVTERKEIEQERLQLSGRLIKAQEEERNRLARELHDDFSQRVALQAVELQIILDALGSSQSDVSERLREVLERMQELGTDLHSLSHNLHSSKLGTLGLSRSVGSLCREFSKQHKIQIDFDQAALSEPIPSETALCLFRIVQEGLQNVNKHSRASRAEVRLTGHPTEISLILSDNGVGFDLSESYTSNGIGILSMKERARMLYGTFEIRSAPMKGTQIAVNIPLKKARATA